MPIVTHLASPPGCFLSRNVTGGRSMEGGRTTSGYHLSSFQDVKNTPSGPRKRETPYRRPHANPGGFVHEAYSVSRSRTPVFPPKTRGNRHKMACLIPNDWCRNLGL